MPSVSLICKDTLLDTLSYSRIPFKNDFLIFNGAAYLVNKVVLVEGSASNVDALVCIEPCGADGNKYAEIEELMH